MKYINILSFDCGNRSLGYTFARINIDILKDIRALNTLARKAQTDDDKLEVAAKTYVLIKNFIRVHKSGVYDVTGASLNKSNSLQKTRFLKKVLDDIDAKFNPEDIVIIEQQPEKLNSKTIVIQGQLCMFYIDHNPVIMPATRKNTICFTKEIHYDVFRMKCRELYVANKQHSIANFLHFIKNYKLEHMIDGIKKANYDDLADSFMQMYYYALHRV